jgi:head-tail adaptor
VLEWKVMRKIHSPIKNEDGRWRIRTNEEINLLF